MNQINLTEETLNHMPAIVRVAGEYKITIMELLGPSKQEKLVAAYRLVPLASRRGCANRHRRQGGRS